jgi:16S rRNA (adenine1518-N6/adenine1519-N6)-dimethyltransferase
MSRLERTKKLLERLEAGPKRSLGQNFLISDHVIGKIIDSVNRNQDFGILEIGPGLGALTFDLKELGRPLCLLELDKKFAEFWRSEGQTVVEGDALGLDWNALVEAGEFKSLAYVSLVSNLPYQISASIVIDRSLGPDKVQEMTLMFQKEVAQRVKAKERTEDYGLLSVIAQTFWDVEIVSDAGPGDFFPPPKVASRVLKFIRKSSEIRNRKAFLVFCKQCFQQRRKMLAGNLKVLNSERLEKSLEWLNSSGLGVKVRAEELNPKQFVELFKYLELDR